MKQLLQKKENIGRKIANLYLKYNAVLAAYWHAVEATGKAEDDLRIALVAFQELGLAGAPSAEIQTMDKKIDRLWKKYNNVKTKNWHARQAKDKAELALQKALKHPDNENGIKMSFPFSDGMVAPIVVGQPA